MAREAKSVATGFRVTPSTNALWEEIAERLGISKVSVIDLLLNEKASAMGINLNATAIHTEHTQIEHLTDGEAILLARSHLPKGQILFIDEPDILMAAFNEALASLLQGKQRYLEAAQNRQQASRETQTLSIESLKPSAPVESEPAVKRGRGRPRKTIRQPDQRNPSSASL